MLLAMIFIFTLVSMNGMAWAAKLVHDRRDHRAQVRRGLTMIDTYVVR